MATYGDVSGSTYGDLFSGPLYGDFGGEPEPAPGTVPQVIVFPDIVAIVVAFLNYQLPLYGHAGTATRLVPTVRPAAFVTVDRLGGPRATLVTDAATIGLESWAQTPEAAMDSAQLCRALLNCSPGQRLPDIPIIYRVDEVSGPQPLPDVSGQPRVVVTFSVHARGAVLAPV